MIINLLHALNCFSAFLFIPLLLTTKVLLYIYSICYYSVLQKPRKFQSIAPDKLRMPRVSVGITYCESKWGFHCGHIILLEQMMMVALLWEQGHQCLKME